MLIVGIKTLCAISLMISITKDIYIACLFLLRWSICFYNMNLTINNAFIYIETYKHFHKGCGDGIRSQAHPDEVLICIAFLLTLFLLSDVR